MILSIGNHQFIIMIYYTTKCAVLMHTSCKLFFVLTTSKSCQILKIIFNYQYILQYSAKWDVRFVIHLNVTNQVITSTIFCFLYQSILHCWQLLCDSNSIYDVGNHVTTQHIQWTDSSTGSRLWVSWQLYMIMSITWILPFIIINI